MSVFHDFEPDPPPDGAPPAPLTEPAPRVVIQYRGRSRALVLLPAVAVAASLVTFVAARRGGEGHRPDPPRARPAPAPVAATPAEPLVVRVAPLPRSESEVPPETIEPPPPETIEPAPAAETPEVAAVKAEPPELTEAEATQQAMAAIRADAEQARQERADMEELRAAVPAIEAQAREQARQAVNARRQEFHRDLRQLIADRGNGAAQAIWDLAILADRGPDPIANREVRTVLERHGPRLDRAGRIALYRRHGLSEPAILAVLFEEQRRLMPSRKGPRNRNDAILRAAKQLLATPPHRAGSATGKGPIADTRSQAPHR
jgi:hypothetical protein